MTRKHTKLQILPKAYSTSKQPSGLPVTETELDGLEEMVAEKAALWTNSDWRVREELQTFMPTSAKNDSPLTTTPGLQVDMRRD